MIAIAARESSIDDIDHAWVESDQLVFSLDRQRYKDSLLAFVYDSWHLVEPGTEFKSNWHIEQLCLILEDALRRGGARLIINIPPGTMKSLLVNVFFCAWAWTKNPRLRWLTASYGAHLTTRDNLRVRQIVQSKWYQGLFPLGFAEDQDTKTRYNTNKGGWRIATSIGGVGTGEHPDNIVIDDAATAVQAKSGTERAAINSWFTGTIPSRGRGQNANIFIVGQRLHAEDLSGYLLAQGGWTHVCWPMRYEKCTCVPDVETCVLHKVSPSWEPDLRDPRTESGQLLWPELFDEEKVKAMEREMLEDASGQLQQRPFPEGGLLFKREWFKFVDASPARRLVARGWDTAATEGKGDYTAGLKVSEEIESVLDSNHPRRPGVVNRTGRFYVEHGVRDQLSPDGVDALMKAMSDSDGKACAIREQREGGASGKAVISARARLLRDRDYEEVHIGVNKVLFSKPFRSQCAAGNVFIVRTDDPAQDAWIEPFIAELCQFPAGKHDDQVDAVSTAFNSLGELSMPQTKGAIW